MIEVVDSGGGMSPEFVRTRLFKPFVSSKPGGFGIGAFEARELIRAMGGRLEVEFARRPWHPLHRPPAARWRCGITANPASQRRAEGSLTWPKSRQRRPAC